MFSWQMVYRVKNEVTTFVRLYKDCLLYTSDAADERSSVDLGGRRIIKKKKKNNIECHVCRTIQ